MSIQVAPIAEPLSHQHAANLAKMVNQTTILVKNTLANGVPAQGNNLAISGADVRSHFSAADLQKLEAIAALA